MIQLTYDIIDSEQLVEAARNRQAGAVVLFLGTTREFTAGRQTTALEYEAYNAMAERELGRLETEARERWSLVYCAIVHRLGQVPLAETSVAIVVSAAHRSEAFAAGSWLIDSLKESAPIWKREQWADGSSAWIHPQPEGMPGKTDSSREIPPASPIQQIPASTQKANHLKG